MSGGGGGVGGLMLPVDGGYRAAAAAALHFHCTFTTGLQLILIESLSSKEEKQRKAGPFLTCDQKIIFTGRGLHSLQKELLVLVLTLLKHP